MRPSSRQVHVRLAILKCVVGHAFITPPFFSDEFPTKIAHIDREGVNAALKQQSEGTVSNLRRHGLWKYVSPKEMTFLQSYGDRMDPYAHRAATWRMECVGMLMWALGLLDSWPAIDSQIDPVLLKSIEVEKPGLFSKYPRLRDHREISAKRNLIELWHWRVRTRRLIEDGQSFEPWEELRQSGITSYDDIVRVTAKAAYERGDLPQILDNDFVFLAKPFRTLPPDEYQQANSIIMERHYALNWLCGFAPGNRWDETPTDT